VSRDRSIDELVAAIEAVARGELVCPPRIAAVLLRRLGVLALRLVPEGAPPPAPTLLTYREREIASLIEQGLSNKQIAHRLGVQLATIKTHVHHILEKLHVHRRIEIAVPARRS
jgi:DNA-binding NarL/FixJ family response regulator